MINRSENKRQSGIVKVRGGFSESIGISLCINTLQIGELDDTTRIRINNCIYAMLSRYMEQYHSLFKHPYSHNYISQDFCHEILNDVFCVNNIIDPRKSYVWQNVYLNYIENAFINATYNEVFDLIEYICHWFESKLQNSLKGTIYNKINSLFEKECVGYRFINGKIVAITDTVEINAIEAACESPFSGYRKHIEKAIGFLSDRDTKDYKNCIKESISAVESICQTILSDNNVVLSDALKQLAKNGTNIHPALNQAFIKLYGYTSDQGGIRHAEGLFESNVTFEEAKFMLVSCCAFTNYLIAEYGKKHQLIY